MPKRGLVSRGGMPAFPRELAVVAGSTACSSFTRTIASSMPTSQMASQNCEDFNYPPLGAAQPLALRAARARAVPAIRRADAPRRAAARAARAGLQPARQHWRALICTSCSDLRSLHRMKFTAHSHRSLADEAHAHRSCRAPPPVWLRWPQLLQGQAAAQPVCCRRWRMLSPPHPVPVLQSRRRQSALGVLALLGRDRRDD